MSNNEISANESIVKMIANLKQKTNTKLFDFTPVKRSRDSNSDELVESKKSKMEIKEKGFMDVSYIGSPREVRRLRSDILSLRNTIISLENQIHQMHGVRKEIQIMYDDEIKGLRSQIEGDRKSIEDLESQLQSIRKRELELRNELVDEKNKYNVLKVDTDKRIEEIEKNYYTLSSNMQTIESEEQDKTIDLQKKLAEVEYLYKVAKDDAESQKILVEELTKYVAEYSNSKKNLEIKEQELTKLRLQLKDYDFVKETYLEIQNQAKSQQYKLSTYSELEKENIKLKEDIKDLWDRVSNKLILEEQVYDLKTRLDAYKEQEKKYTMLQVSHAQNEKHLEEWRALARSICETSEDDINLQKQVRDMVEHLQQREIYLTSDKMQLESHLKIQTHEKSVSQTESDKNKKLATLHQISIQKQQNLIHRMQKKLTLVSRERDSYRKQLDSYEKDLTICMNPASTAQPGNNQLMIQKERIDNLEKVVDGYREMVAKLENELESVTSHLHSDEVPIREHQMNRLKDELDKLNSENKMLRDRKDELEIKIEELLVGQDNVQDNVRVIHMVKNPLQDCVTQERLEKEKLMQEIEKLKNKIRKIEEGSEVTKLANTTSDIVDMQALKEKLKTSETQINRLKEYFKCSTQEFRNVIYMLLGYKIDKSSNSQYRLTSIYAEKEEDQLCFQLNPEGTMDLLENQFSAGLDRFVDLHLRHQKSIPVFLSAITMDLYSCKTVTGSFTFNNN